MDDQIALLKRHYLGNILPLPGPDPKFEKLSTELRDPEKFSQIVAEGFGDDGNDTGGVTEGDVRGLGLYSLIPELSLVVLKVFDEKAAGALKKKLGIDDADGATFSREWFGSGSPFYGINVVVFNGDSDIAADEHEKAHVWYDELSKSGRDISEAMGEAKEDGDSEKYLESLCLDVESHLLSESLVWGGSMSAEFVKKYAGYFSEGVGDKMYECPDLLPESGIISRHNAQKTAENYMRDRLEERFDSANGACRKLLGNLPVRIAARIVMSCGPTREELESGMYTRPVDELVLWSKSCKEVLGVESGGQ